MDRLPNWLTWTRLVAVPVVVVLLGVDDGAEGTARWWALAVFVGAAFTDFLDGYLARRWRVVTSFGKIADPIADKALVLATLTMLVITDDLPWWPLVILAIREIAVTIGRLSVVATTVIPASRGGKLKTALQLAALTFYLIPGAPAWLDVVAWWLLVASVVVAVLTWIDYEVQLARARRESAGIPALASEVIAAARAAGVTIACAESLTGGSLCSALVEAPGASSVVRGGVVAYQGDVKMSSLGVDPAVIAAHSLVSTEVAIEMAAGVRRTLGADLGVATTGAAGPEPHDGAAPGTVCLAVVGGAAEMSIETVIHGTRARVREQTVKSALAMLLDSIATRGDEHDISAEQS